MSGLEEVVVPGEEQSGTVAQQISTDELRRRLLDPDLTIVDVRPLHAYNGWRLDGEARGGHILGAVAFPSAWLASVDDAEVVRLLHSKEIVTSQEVVLYGAADDVSAVGARLTELGHTGVRSYELERVVGGREPARRASPELRPARPHRMAPAGARRRPPRGCAGRTLPALPRQLRRPRGVRGESPPRRLVPRHEPAREPRGLEPSHAGGARRRRARARHHARHDGHPLRPRHRRATRTRSGPVVAPGRSPPRARR